MQQYTLCENQPSACTNAYHTPSSSSSLTNDMSGEVQNLSQQQSGEADEQSLLDEIVREGGDADTDRYVRRAPPPPRGLDRSVEMEPKAVSFRGEGGSSRNSKTTPRTATKTPARPSIHQPLCTLTIPPQE